MRALVNSTLLLGAGSFIHALRVIVLSFVLGNREFGAVSTILLISTLFAEFGSLGFSQLVYNQRLYTPGIISRESVNVSRFVMTGLSTISVMALATALAISVAGPLHFETLLLTLVCAAANVMILAACRASNSKFTHPTGYLIKSLIVLVDIVILGSGRFTIESIVLWGEVLATPVLLLYAWRSGVFRPRWSILRRVPALFAAHRGVAFWAIFSSMSALLFFNQERMAGVFFLTLEQTGLITKIILIKIVGAQSAFILGTYFHRHIVGSDQAGRSRTFSAIRRYEWAAYGALTAACLMMMVPVQWAYQALYGIQLSYEVAISAMVLGIMFFFNPFAILLQASGRFATVALTNAFAAIVFFALTLFNFETNYVIIASAAASLLWFVLIRRAAYRLLSSLNNQSGWSARI